MPQSEAHEPQWLTIRDQLEASRLAARKRRLVLSGPPLVCGLLLLAAGGVTLGMSPIGGRSWVASTLMIATGQPLMLLALLPSDSRSIKITGVAISAISLAVALYALDRTVANSLIGWGVPTCSATDYMYAGVLTWQALTVAWLVAGSYSAHGLVQALRGRIWPSVLLLRLHRTLALCYLATGAVLLSSTAMLVTRSPPIFGTVHFGGIVALCALACAIGVLELTTDVRARVHGWLAASGELMSSATGIAAMLHSSRIDSVLQSAAERFRGVRLDKLTPAVFRWATDAHQLYETTLPARFADVDAFISHSHHDDPAARWAALQAWRREFVSSFGREPTVWIDTCCIDTTSPALDVGNLPCYIAGCNEFVLLAGPTFVGRLWQTVEVCVWTHIGLGVAQERLTLFELPGYNRELAIETYDVRACASMNRADYFRLLACIESACDGGLDAFNGAMRSLLSSVPTRRGFGLEGGAAPGGQALPPHRLASVSVVPASAIPPLRLPANNTAQITPGLRSPDSIDTIVRFQAEVEAVPPPDEAVPARDDWRGPADGAAQHAGHAVPAAPPPPAGRQRAALHAMPGLLPCGASRARRASRAAGRLALVLAYALVLTGLLAWGAAPAEADCRACERLLREQLPSGGERAGEWLAPAFANGTSEYLFSGLGGIGARPGQSSWGGALAMCRAEGGALVAIGSEAEGRFVYCMQRYASMGTWIGYSRQGREGWAWAGGAPVGGRADYVEWAQGEPVLERGECAVVGQERGQGWSTTQCNAPESTSSTLLAYMCERPPSGAAGR